MDSRSPITGVGREAALRESMCALWQEAFGDDRQFIMHYLCHYSHPHNRILRFSTAGNRVVAMMHWHEFTFGQQPVGKEPLVALSPMPQHLAGCRGAYIYGVATARAWRGHGLARAMIAEAAATMRRCGTHYAMLIAEEPSLRQWYATMGFTLCEGCTATITAPCGTNLALDDTALCVPMIARL